MIRSLRRCRCGASIFFALSTVGKAMPIDAEPVVGGNLMLSQTNDGKLVASVDNAASALLLPEPRYVSHFATCPDAAKFRRPRKRSGALRQPS